jgi:hypothetical protein
MPQLPTVKLLVPRSTWQGAQVAGPTAHRELIQHQGDSSTTTQGAAAAGAVQSPSALAVGCTEARFPLVASSPKP